MEKGKAIVVTRREKPVVTIKPFEAKDQESQYPTNAFDALRGAILAKQPQLARETPKKAARQLGETDKKTRRALPFKSWQEMDRAGKGDRYGFSR